MLYFKMLSMLALAAGIFVCCDKTPTTAGNGSETENAFSGRILYGDGSPAAGVSVRVLPVDNVPSIAAAKSIVVTTDSNGYYNVAGLDSGLYNVEGLKDTLGVFIDSIAVKAKPSIPVGILKTVGKITGVTHMEGQSDTNQVRVTLYMPGTSRITKPVIGGRFNFDNMPEGRYQLIIDPLPQYVVKVIDIPVISGQTLDLDTIRLDLYEPDTIDIYTSSIFGTWGPARTYRLHNTVEIPQGMTLTILPGTKVLFMGRTGIDLGCMIAEGTADSMILFTSGLPDPVQGSWLNVGGSQTNPPYSIFKYCIFEYSTNGLSIVSTARIQVENCVFRKNSSALSINSDSAVVSNCLFHDDIRGVSFSGGYLGFFNNILVDIGNAFRIYQPNPIDARYNCFFHVDTVILPKPDSSGNLEISLQNLFTNPAIGTLPPDYILPPASPCKGTGFLGMDMGIYDTLKTGYIERFIRKPVSDAGRDKCVFAGHSVTLTGIASDPLGVIAKMEWDIGNKGAFLSCPSGAISFQAPDSFSRLGCTFRATDDDGNTGMDTIILFVLTDSTPSSRMKPVPGGSFIDPQGDTAIISYPFWADSTEVTQADFESVMKYNPSTAKGSNMPVTDIRLYEAVLYCNELSKLNHLDTIYSYYGITTDSVSGVDTIYGAQVHRDRNGFRLPTGDEWMLACMGGTGSFYYWKNPQETNKHACLAGFGYTQPLDVAALLPNPYGLYDMAGNVNEFWWEQPCLKPSIRTDFFCQVTTTCLIVGGGYNSPFADAQTPIEVSRFAKYSNLGFRCVRLAK